MSSRGPQKKLKTESKEKVKKVEISTLFQFFDSFSTLFLTFGALGPEGPGNSFSTPFPTLGPKGPRTPLGGWKGRNALSPSRNPHESSHETSYEGVHRSAHQKCPLKWSGSLVLFSSVGIDSSHDLVDFELILIWLPGLVKVCVCAL